MSIFISRDSTGLARNIIVDGDNITLTDAQPGDHSWHLESPAFRSIARVAAARSIPLQIVPDDPRVTWWSQWTKSPRVDHILPRSVITGHITKLIKACRLALDDPYFTGQYQIQNRLIDLLENAHVDTRSLEGMDENVISSFGIDSGSLCFRAEYDNFSSSTGRMSIKSGPKILTMNKEHRHAFKSAWGAEGTLLSVDYSALEPRVIMTLMGQKNLPKDIYAAIGEKVKIESIERKTLKLMILAILYGMSRRNFIVKFMSESDPDIAYDRIRSALGVSAILESIKKDMTGGMIKNHYGRPLKCDNESLYVNHFTQSTAVDVACDGFLNLIQENKDIVRPIFILHDELILDINNSDLDRFHKHLSGGIYIPSLSTTFQVTTKVFNARKSN